ncbi:MAG: phosphoenolpyruvate synthase [Candidatus Diapherotrites archaeon]
MQFVLWFKDVGKDDVGTAGGKASNLGEMTNAGFPVPPGFVVSAQAYFAFIERTGLKKKLVEIIDAIDVERTMELEEKAKQVRALILSAKMPEDISVEIQKAYMKLSSTELPIFKSSSELAYVAVRSSATAEDLPEASFAGQQDTYLNMLGRKELTDAVQRCWASLFTARAVYYRKKQGFPTDKVGIAVVVQKMVESESSGIMFTAEPATGDTSKIVIEAGLGLGEAIVSGSITPDTFVIEKDSMQLMSKKISVQKWRIVKSGKGTKREEIQEKIGAAQKLSDKFILELAGIGAEIEAHYGAPQDIEWALEKNKLYIVQSRAITTIKSGRKAKEGEEAEEKKLKKGLVVLTRGLAASPGISYGKVKLIPSVEQIEKVEEGDVLVTKMTAPDWVPAMRKSAAIVTEEGGTTCHASIVSRELGIPCVVGTLNALTAMKNSAFATVDGFKGLVYEGKAEIEVDSREKEKIKTVEVKEFDELEKALKKEETELFPEKKARDGIDGIWNEYGKVPAEKMSAHEQLDEEEKLLDVLRSVAVKVKVNVALPEAAESAAATGADGIGLLRAEHMITGSGEHPAEFLREGKYGELVETVKNGVRKVALLFKGKPVWYRTFDARSDEFRHLKGGEKEPHEDNPMIGWHGIRRDLDEPELLKAQLEGIRQLREEGLDNVGVMLPFVISAEEVRKAKEIAREVGLFDGGKCEFGVMVETPAAVWVIDELIAEGIDFISFGTNDLTQLTLGIDRNNERIQKIFSELHPAVQRELEHVIKKCKKAGVKTSICGQAGSNPAMVKNLVRMGIDSVSANIDAVEKIRSVVLLEEKKLILEKAHKK